jgi:hypothetical protein
VKNNTDARRNQQPVREHILSYSPKHRRKDGERVQRAQEVVGPVRHFSTTIAQKINLLRILTGYGCAMNFLKLRKIHRGRGVVLHGDAGGLAAGGHIHQDAGTFRHGL